MEQLTFKVGDQVKWESQSQGIVRMKRGVIAAVIPRGGDAMAYYKKCAKETDRPKLRDGERDHQSYLVRVPPPPNRGKLDVIYWPLVAYLTVDKSNRKV